MKSKLENLIYKFELGPNTSEATKNICYMKGKGGIDHNRLKINK